jgi:DNA-binding response OmpR family regulator
VADAGPRILIIEDDAGIGANLQRALASEGVVRWERTAASGLDAARDDCPDLVLLDLGLPDGDGIDVCHSLLARMPAARIIILTARDTEIDVVVGLDSGAVDYVTKPFRLAELQARVRVHLRRATADSDAIVIGDLVIDRAARLVTVAGTPVDFRPKEFDLLVCLAAAVGTALRREDLMTAVWDEHWFGSTKTLDVTVASLRRKLEAAGATSVEITTLRGVGYRLEHP